MSDKVLKLPLNLDSMKIEFNTGDGDDAVSKTWTLTELTGKQRNVYLGRISSRIKVRDGRSLGIRNFEGFQSDLLLLCLTDENNEKVSKEDIEALPAAAQATLFKEAQEISGLNNDPDDDEDEAKND